MEKNTGNELEMKYVLVLKHDPSGFGWLEPARSADAENFAKFLAK